MPKTPHGSPITPPEILVNAIKDELAQGKRDDDDVHTGNNNYKAMNTAGNAQGKGGGDSNDADDHATPTSNQHASDLLKLWVLNHTGGVWIDSTTFVTDRFERWLMEPTAAMGGFFILGGPRYSGSAAGGAGAGGNGGGGGGGGGGVDSLSSALIASVPADDPLRGPTALPPLPSSLSSARPLTMVGRLLQKALELGGTGGRGPAASAFYTPPSTTMAAPASASSGGKWTIERLVAEVLKADEALLLKWKTEPDPKDIFQFDNKYTNGQFLVPCFFSFTVVVL